VNRQRPGTETEEKNTISGEACTSWYVQAMVIERSLDTETAIKNTFQREEVYYELE